MNTAKDTSKEFEGKPFILDLKGIGNFKDSVVFTSVQDGPQMEHLQTVAGE